MAWRTDRDGVVRDQDTLVGSNWDWLRLTCWFVQMREIRQVITGLEHRWIHQRGQRRVIAALESLQAELDLFFLFQTSDNLFSLAIIMR